MLYFDHPACLEHDPRQGLPGHPESPERLRAIEAALGERDWLGWERREAPAAREEELLLVHPREHVEGIRDLCASGGGAIDLDTFAGEASYEAALRAAGGACEMTRALLHQGGIFPGTGAREDTGAGPGEGCTINLPVAAGSGEDVWLPLLEREVLPAAARFEPQLVLISAGFDAHRDDPLAGCRLETSSFGRMATAVRAAAAEWNAPVGAVLEGGYDLQALADSVVATMSALGGKPG